MQETPKPSREPDHGTPGLLDRYLGPGASASDWLRVAIAALGGLLLGMLTLEAPLSTRVLMGLVTAELCAGLIAQLNPAAKHWTHRPDRRLLRLAGFVVLQWLALALFVVLLRSEQPQLWLSAVLLLTASALAVVFSPPAWQRALGLTALLASLFALQSWHGLERNGAWFLPLLFARTLLAKLPLPREARSTGDD